VEEQPSKGIDVYDSSDSEAEERHFEPKSDSKWASIYGESADKITGSIGHSVDRLNPNKRGRGDGGGRGRGRGARGRGARGGQAKK
jgi:hypothetical protein